MKCSDSSNSWSNLSSYTNKSSKLCSLTNGTLTKVSSFIKSVCANSSYNMSLSLKSCSNMGLTLAQEVESVYIVWTILTSTKEHVVCPSILNIFNAIDISPNDSYMRSLLQSINVFEILKNGLSKIMEIWFHGLGVGAISKIIKSKGKMNLSNFMSTSLTIPRSLLTERSSICNVALVGWRFPNPVTDKQCMEANWHLPEIKPFQCSVSNHAWDYGGTSIFVLNKQEVGENSKNVSSKKNFLINFQASFLLYKSLRNLA